MIQTWTNLAPGKKTYFLAGLAILWGVVGYFFGWLELDKAKDVIWLGLGLAGLRSAIK